MSNKESNGNNQSHGNNWGNGNNRSHGNNWSNFLFNCRGSHKSAFCKDQRGIAYMWFNQQMTKDQGKELYNKLFEILDNWKPYVTNFCELKEKGWHTKHDDNNKYVEEEIEDNEVPFTKQYHYAWSKCPYKKEIIELIKSVDYIDSLKGQEVLAEITGIKDLEDEQVTIKISKKSLEALKESGIEIVE